MSIDEPPHRPHLRQPDVSSAAGMSTKAADHLVTPDQQLSELVQAPHHGF
jgi:hypothetical protein